MFNVCCFGNPIVARFLFRSAYGIPGSACDDCMYGTCCGPCVVNQLLQTSEAYGQPGPNVGPTANTDVWRGQMGNDNCCGNCMYAFCCPTCAIGSTMEKEVQMPFLLGCCCMSSCLMRNVTRYQYRINGDDMVEDCLTPCGMGFLSYCCICALPCTIAYLVNLTMKPMAEVEVRTKDGYPREYLASKDVPSAPAAASTTVMNPAVVIVNNPANY